ncbi:MAG: DUF4173 domain-containing protein [Oscillospiraceae bacterium]|nr:DUF4173 domain-containing protein [Oscillospiraceae bacterium]
MIITNPETSQKGITIMGIKFCPTCRASVKEGDIFCQKCRILLPASKSLPGTPTVKPPKVYNTADLVASLICIAFGYIFVKFVIMDTVSLYAMMFNFAFFVLAFFYTKSKLKNRKISPKHTAVIIFAFLFNGIYAVTSNVFIGFIGGSFAVLLGIYIFFVSVNGLPAFADSLPLDLLRSVFAVPFSGFGECTSVVAANVQNAQKNKSGKKIGHIFVGLLISIPVTVVCAGLLMKADDSFSALINTITDFDLAEIFDFILKFALGIPVACYLFGMLYSNTSKVNDPSSDAPYSTHTLPVSIICSAVAPVCVLYVIFFISHFSYLTSALYGSLHTAFSHAQYARQGFFELCAVAVINLGIIIFLNVFDKKSEDGITSKAVKFFTSFIIISTVILIITALGKMLLYIENYGLTQLRVYTSWFMILLLMSFIVIFVKTFKEKLRIFKPLFAIFAVMFGLLCFGDVDGRIADYNTSAYIDGRLDELDISLFYDLSDSAVKYAIPLANDPKYGNQVRLYLDAKYNQLRNLSPKYYNYETLTALDLLRDFYKN